MLNVLMTAYIFTGKGVGTAIVITRRTNSPNHGVHVAAEKASI